MRTLTLTALLSVAPLCLAAPVVAEKPRWEYAELTYRSLPGRGAGTDADGNEVPAVPPSMTIRWVSGAGEVEAKGWGELAEKLKTPFKKDGSAAFQRIQMLNLLGGDGWELLEQTGTTTTTGGFVGGAGPKERGTAGRSVLTSTTAGTWLLKRRAP